MPIDLYDKRVLIREDFNVPIENGKIASDMRIKAALPGIKEILRSAKQVLIMSHLGRPKEGCFEEKYSLAPIVGYLEKSLGMPVKFVSNWNKPNISVDDKLILFENIRFLEGEKENSEKLAKQMASLCDVFVMDAFASCHRAHASTYGVAQYAKRAVAGPLLQQELNVLNNILDKPAKPLVAILGGAKVSDKVDLLRSLAKISDQIIVGGGMANTLLVATGCDVAKSLFEPNSVGLAKEILTYCNDHKTELLLPIDVILEDGKTKNIIDVMGDDKIMDIGLNSIERFRSIIKRSKTILWNGPMGVFEDAKFANGTKAIAEAIVNSKAYSVVGGGDTISALEQYNLQSKMSYVSTGGGAFLEYIINRKLPGIELLQF